MVAYRIRQYEVTINTYYADNLPSCRLNVNAIMQVLINLINNALDAVTSVNKKVITIDVTYQDNKLLIKIADTGAGIAPENLSKIFDFFFTTKPPSNGTGLGLPISRRIIEAHGGELFCNSKIDQGTDFTILLPLERRRSLDNQENSK